MKKNRLCALYAWLFILFLVGCGSTVEETLEPQEQRRQNSAASAYTIMVYLNGSDLESSDGLASGDLEEMLIASEGFNSEKISLVVQTGGTKQWQSDIPSDFIVRYLIADGFMEELEQAPLASIGDPDTLTDFITFSVENYPADRYALILWNHGGGAISGYGVDELFENDNLTLSELDTALYNAGLEENKLELIGFDACLMATLETASITSRYAHYLVASEEIEPGYGWAHDVWLSALGKSSYMDGAELGEHIATSFVDFYNENDMEDELTTLSVIDLSQVQNIVDALESFASVANASLIEGNYREIARPRSRSFEFGMPTVYGGSTDMIDVIDMANQFADICPEESNVLATAVENAVVFKNQGRYVKNANGLSLYFPYSEKEDLPYLIPQYQDIDFSPTYIDYVSRFSEMLTGENFAEIDISAIKPDQNEKGNDLTIALSQEEIEDISEIYFSVWSYVDDEHYVQVYQDNYVEIDNNGVITTEFDGLLVMVGGELACLIEINSGEDFTRYAAAGLLNGQMVNFIVIFDEYVPNGKVIGAVPVYDSETHMPSKQTIPIKDGDSVAFSYYMMRFVDMNSSSQDMDDDEIWFDGDAFEVEGELTVEAFEVDEGTYLYGFEVIDYQNNSYYTDFIEVEF